MCGDHSSIRPVRCRVVNKLLTGHLTYSDPPNRSSNPSYLTATTPTVALHHCVTWLFRHLLSSSLSPAGGGCLLAHYSLPSVSSSHHHLLTKPRLFPSLCENYAIPSRCGRSAASYFARFHRDAQTGRRNAPQLQLAIFVAASRRLFASVRNSPLSVPGSLAHQWRFW